MPRNSTECPFYNICGLNKLRTVNSAASKLPPDGDCGIPRGECQRAAEGSDEVVTSLLPLNQREFNIAFPPNRFLTTRDGGQGRIP